MLRNTRLSKLTFLCLSIIYGFSFIQYRSSYFDATNGPHEQQYLKRTFDQLVRSNEKITKDRIQRALVLFYPDNQEKKYLPELRWFYRTWIEMMNVGESKYWRTDLIIFTGNFTTNLQKLACVFNQIRVNRDEIPTCRVFPYFRVSARDPSLELSIPSIHKSRSMLLYEQLRTYHYVDSINIIVEGYPVFKMYDYILKTDIDVFLTKYFGFYIPITDKTLLTGLGGYSVDFNENRLRRIARDLGWSYANMSNIGSTWYGPPDVAYRIANLTLDAMLYLNQNEFTQAEREKMMGTMNWPEWHYGVLSMYASQLAVNHLVVKDRIDVQIADKLLDQAVKNTDQNDLDTYHRLHLHCWHLHVPFSKFDFKNNIYDGIDLQILANDTSAQAYAMRMALESKRMTLEQLAQQLIVVQQTYLH